MHHFTLLSFLSLLACIVPRPQDEMSIYKTAACINGTLHDRVTLYDYRLPCQPLKHKKNNEDSSTKRGLTLGVILIDAGIVFLIISIIMKRGINRCKRRRCDDIIQDRPIDTEMLVVKDEAAALIDN